MIIDFYVQKNVFAGWKRTMHWLFSVLEAPGETASLVLAIFTVCYSCHPFPGFRAMCPSRLSNIYIYILLVVSTPLKNISQIGSSSQLLWKIKNVLFCAGRYAAALECADAAERVRRIKCRGHVPTVCQNLWPATAIVVEGKTQPVEKCHHVFGNQGPHDDSKPIEKTDEWCK